MKRLLIFLLVLCAGASRLTAQLSNNTATGIIRNEKGEALEGAVIQLQQPAGDFKQSTTTNKKGLFTFGNVPAGTGYSFIVSYVGYLTDTLPGYEMKEGGRISLSVNLRNKVAELDKIVVVGYGTMRKKDLSAAVAEVPDMQQIQERPVLDVANMIQGKVAGVTVVSNGGHPNSTPEIVIRGKGSRGNESPLFVVDGVPNAPYNPADVVSMTILKDAASAAIYGAFSGSAGVILVTTRQAKQGKPSVEYAGFVGMKQAWKTPQSLTADKEAEVSNLAFTNAGQAPLDGWNASINPDAQVTRTDWIDEIFRTALVQRHTVTVNAGSEKFSTLFQGRYEENQGTLINTYSKNLSARFNALYSFNSKFKFKQELFINNHDSRGTETSSGYTGTILSAIYMPRSATPYYEDGTFGGVGPRNSDYLGIHGDVVNPVATLLRNKPYDRSTDIQSVSELRVANIVKGLSFLTRFSYRQGSSLYKNFEPRRTEPGKPNDQNTLSYSTGKTYNWIWENTLNYSKTIGRHNIGAMASTTAQEFSDRGFTAAAKTFDNEANWAQFLVNAGNFTDLRPSDWEIKDRNVSYVGRVSYSWADRYFVTGSYRYDLAGRLGDGFRGQGFPGVTAAWKVSSEPFFNFSAIELLKVRASWGMIGNIGSVRYYYGYPTLTPDYTYQIGNGAPQSNALYMASAVNQSLSWETSEQKDLGLDLSLPGEKLSFTFDYFDKLTDNLINPMTSWPSTMGIAPPYINQGKIRNTGYEFSATYTGNVRDVKYVVSGNVATLKNRVEYIDGNPASVWQHTDAWRGTIAPYRSAVGQPYYSYWLIKTDGIFQNEKQITDHAGPNGELIQPNAKPGDLKFVDQNNDGKIDDKDRVYMGASFPKLTYGFTANVTWKRFDLSMFWQGVSGVKLFNAFKESTLNASEQGYNRWDKILDAWSPTNTGSNIPRISASDANKNFQTPSDWYLENGDYLRLKSLVIGYNFPKVFKTATMRVYLSGDNLITITKYSGMDPEVGGIGLDGGQFPVSRVFAAGVKLSL
ncbi:SusC/RagA family TonB-linked outer membrane protein [Flavihumibacter petaseus]|uniref:Putative TonB-dependent receptor n=1 Tax=Flavihumibacter petaseus NBRC 106054 TaxID=1220578 RepID=A0A0E9N208_9BACT|nr:SusC/RagA family TonB-linked outer membrane protein [Flavihumibacter petaseus]GAO44047.1 putative TonB-dependent receptor [Flavihumibacter petaseus NBRC 106054]